MQAFHDASAPQFTCDLLYGHEDQRRQKGNRLRGAGETWRYPGNVDGRGTPRVDYERNE